MDDNIFNVITLQTILDLQMKLKSDKALNGQQAIEIITEKIREKNMR